MEKIDEVGMTVEEVLRLQLREARRNLNKLGLKIHRLRERVRDLKAEREEEWKRWGDQLVELVDELVWAGEIDPEMDGKYIYGMSDGTTVTSSLTRKEVEAGWESMEDDDEVEEVEPPITVATEVRRVR